MISLSNHFACRFLTVFLAEADTQFHIRLALGETRQFLAVEFSILIHVKPLERLLAESEILTRELLRPSVPSFASIVIQQTLSEFLVRRAGFHGHEWAVIVGDFPIESDGGKNACRDVAIEVAAHFLGADHLIIIDVELVENY